jgi:hypothetical protein
MTQGYIRTIEDMERLYYGAGAGTNAWAYSGTDLLKADSPLTSTTTGTYNAIFGRKVWSQLNQEFNAFSILPKKPWEKSGWRVVTGKPDEASGIAENGTLPDSTKPTFQEVNTKPKTVASKFDLSETAMFLADKDDGLGDARAVIKMEMSKSHAESINKMLLRDVNIVAGNNFESIDRATSSSFIEKTGMDDIDAITVHNQYSLTRNSSGGSAREWYDANVDAGANSSSNERPLTLNILDGMFRSVWERGGQPKVILTGYDTVEKIQQLLQPQQRFTEMKRVAPSVNGVQGVPGMDAGFVVATYNGVPIIPSKDVVDDGLSRLYFIDTDYTYFCTAKPTLYHESGIETGDPFGINRLGQVGLFHTMGDLWQLFYGAHGKIRDLSA